MPIDLCRDAAPIDLYRDAAPIDLYRDAAPIDLYRDAAPIDLYRDAAPIDLCRAAGLKCRVLCESGLKRTMRLRFGVVSFKSGKELDSCGRTRERMSCAEHA